MGACLAVLFALYLFVVATSPSDEVVVLVTRDSDGAAHTTALWIVEDADQLWLRSGSPTGAWLAHLRDDPDVELLRSGGRSAHRAVPLETAEARDRVNALMAEKYGTSDDLVRLVGDTSRSVPIRLDPR